MKINCRLFCLKCGKLFLISSWFQKYRYFFLSLDDFLLLYQMKCLRSDILSLDRVGSILLRMQNVIWKKEKKKRMLWVLMASLVKNFSIFFQTGLFSSKTFTIFWIPLLISRMRRHYFQEIIRTNVVILFVIITTFLPLWPPA